MPKVGKKKFRTVAAARKAAKKTGKKIKAAAKKAMKKRKY
jgi:hypothetical protein